jgi:hypothetical protein
LSPNLDLGINRERNQPTTTIRDAGTQGPSHIDPSPPSSSPAALPADPESRPVRPPAALSPTSSATRGAGGGTSNALEVVPRPLVASHPCVEEIELTPAVPSRVLDPPAEGIDQALLMTLVARVVKLSAAFKLAPDWTPEQARMAILSVLAAFGCPLWWIGKALDQAERRPGAKVGNKPVESWGFIRQVVSNWSRGDGTPGSPPVSKAGVSPGPPCPAGVLVAGNPSRSPPRPGVGVHEAELCELSSAELRDRIAEMEAILSDLSSSPRLRLSEQLRGQLSQARSLLAAREVGT